MWRAIVLCFLVSSAYAADVEWSRLRGTVKALDFKAQRITIQNHEGDLLSILVTPDVHIAEGKSDTEIPIKDVHLDAKVTLTRIPAADKPKEESFEDMNGPTKQPR
jgi:hypothetical protein